ncbi:hypothetical protein ElyMa_002455000 [Elysia marginata]|uniref:Uncharacterized protein n=1 Tax=Elysia marginata TaxID=1093978 RepID=A0AAV4GM68_9GAST|nr:hypothetical protein ElyMa_002455000 [Elysia marginata]
MGIELKVKKAKVTVLNIKEQVDLKTTSGAGFSKTGGLKYLGMWFESTEEDLTISGASAMRVAPCNLYRAGVVKHASVRRVSPPYRDHRCNLTRRFTAEVTPKQ